AGKLLAHSSHRGQSASGELPWITQFLRLWHVTLPLVTRMLGLGHIENLDRITGGVRTSERPDVGSGRGRRPSDNPAPRDQSSAGFLRNDTPTTRCPGRCPAFSTGCRSPSLPRRSSECWPGAIPRAIWSRR